MWTPQPDPTGQSDPRMMSSTRSAFDLELEQHKFLEESQYENKNSITTRGSMHQIGNQK